MPFRLSVPTHGVFRNLIKMEQAYVVTVVAVAAAAADVGQHFFQHDVAPAADEGDRLRCICCMYISVI